VIGAAWEDDRERAAKELFGLADAGYGYTRSSFTEPKCEEAEWVSIGDHHEWRPTPGGGRHLPILSERLLEKPLDDMTAVELVALLCRITARQKEMEELEDEFVDRGFDIEYDSILIAVGEDRTFAFYKCDRYDDSVSVRGDVFGNEDNYFWNGDETRSPQSDGEGVEVRIGGGPFTHFGDCYDFFNKWDQIPEDADADTVSRILGLE
jgi:hypothetical protein